MSKIDVKKLKSKLNLKHYEQIIKALNIPIINKTNTKWILLTGCHHHNPYDGSAKLYLYLDSMMFQCVTQCSASFDIITLCQKRLSLLKEPSSFMDCIKYIMDITGIEEDGISRINKTKYAYDWEEDLGKFLRFKNYGSDLKIYDKSILSGFSKVYPLSWLEEGISPQTLSKYKIRYYERLNATLIPCFSKEGNLIGIRVRNWQPEEVDNGRKYMPLITLDGTCYKFDTNKAFYGINYNIANIESTQSVIITEGEKSVLKADTWWDEKSNVLALYGSAMGTVKRNQLIRMGVKHITLALDSDFHEANLNDEEYVKFENKIMKIAKLFKGYCDVDVMYNNLGLDGYKCSPFDFDYKTYQELYKSREEIRWEN